MNIKMDMTLKEAAKLYPCTKRTLYVAIHNFRLSAKKQNGRWIITEQELVEYKKNRWSRNFSKHNEELIFDKSKRLHSASEAAYILNCHVQHVYHALRKDKLKSHRIKSSWVIHLDDIIEYKSIMKLGKKHKRGKWSQN